MSRAAGARDDRAAASAPARSRLAGARPWGRHAVEAAAGLGLLTLSWLLLADRRDTVPDWEADVFHALNGLPDALRWPLWPVMQLGAAGVGLAVAAVVYMVGNRWRPAAAVATAVLLGWVASKVVKDVIQRGRPGDLLDDVVLRAPQPSGYGYVSGHTTVAFALATALTAVLPGRWRWVPLPLALVVGVARIFFGAHLPLDVLGGAGLGVLCGLVASIAFGAIPTPPPDDPAA